MRLENHCILMAFGIQAETLQYIQSFYVYFFKTGKNNMIQAPTCEVRKTPSSDLPY